MPNRSHNGREASAFVFLQDRRDLWSQISKTNFRKHAFSIWGGGIFPLSSSFGTGSSMVRSSWVSNVKMSGSGRLRDLSCIFRITEWRLMQAKASQVLNAPHDACPA